MEYNGTLSNLVEKEGFESVLRQLVRLYGQHLTKREFDEMNSHKVFMMKMLCKSLSSCWELFKQFEQFTN